MAYDELPPLTNVPEPEHTNSGIPRIALESITKVREQTSALASRLRIIEEQLSIIRSHLELVDSSMLEKHKVVVKELRDMEQSNRDMRTEIAKANDLIERTIRRLEGLATKEEVKVLERYIELMKPMNYMTRDEAKSLIQKIIKEQSLGKKNAIE